MPDIGMALAQARAEAIGRVLEDLPADDQAIVREMYKEIESALIQSRHAVTVSLIGLIVPIFCSWLLDLRLSELAFLIVITIFTAAFGFGSWWLWFRPRREQSRSNLNRLKAAHPVLAARVRAALQEVHIF